MNLPDLTRRPWVMRMRWLDLLFAHWPIRPEVLAEVLPPPFEPDLFEGLAYVGIVPFRMEDVAVRGLPAPPFAGAFPEINVRTYVRYGDLTGVWFFSLDATSRLAVEGARTAFHLPYYTADMEVGHVRDVVDYRSVRIDERGSPARFEARYSPIGAVERAAPGSLEAWLTDRPRLLALDDDGIVLRTEVRHRAWPLQPAVARIEMETMAAAAGITLPDAPPHLRYSGRLDVRGWWPKRV